MGYTHLTIYERGRIEELVDVGFSKREIGLKLNRSPSTIGRELKGCFATFIETKTRLYTALKIQDCTLESMEKAIKNLYEVLPVGAFKTATTDRGKEFACAKNIESELGISVYFADAHSPWQIGSNENANGLLREFFSKKTDLSTVSEKELVDTLFLINSRPRKCLH